ncbi:phosphoribosyltransferase family protein [Zhouia sp. PK063]|uniref:phosphoribosyltransferase family protein n=1 Tax=Zhouia sp. PK063 TaxID=3373602 RepID=UPI00378CB9C2
MTTTQNRILNHEEIQHKIQRIAYQIYETFINEDEIIIAGIADSGLAFAKKIAVVFQDISNIKVTLCEVNMNKKNPRGTITATLSEEEFKNKCIVLADDVLNSGETLIYGVAHFLNVPLKKFKTAVLVDRSHKRYPVKADFKGISLSTSIQEHVNVVFKDNDDAVFLT